MAVFFHGLELVAGHKPASPVWKIGGSGIALPAATFLLANGVECA
jgi:hypothetical protein